MGFGYVVSEMLRSKRFYSSVIWFVFYLLAGRGVPMRFTLCYRCGQVCLVVALITEGDVASGITAYQRVVENRPPYAVRRSRYTPIFSHTLFLVFTINKDFNLDFYTEVQDLSHLENALSSASPRYSALNMAICQLIEDFSLVGFETLAVEVRISPLPLPLHEEKHNAKNPDRTNSRC